MTRRSKSTIVHPRGIWRLVEWMKSLLIVLLAISALYLALRTGVYSTWSDVESGLLGGVLSLWEHPMDAQQENIGSAKPTAATYPVRMAVYVAEGRFGTQYDAAQTATLYSGFSGLLGEALSSASEITPVTESAWQNALQQTGVYFDFLAPVPLAALQRWLGDGTAEINLTASAHQLVLAHDGEDRVTLYYQDGSDNKFYACTTAVSYMGHLEDAVAGYMSNGATFVFEHAPEAGYDGLDSYVMILSTPPSPLVYQGSTPLNLTVESNYTAIQEALQFSTQPSSAYRVGDEVVVRDGDDILRMYDDGTITFHSGEGELRYPVVEASTTAYIEVARQLVADAMAPYCGSAEVIFSGLTANEDGSYEVRFSYLLDGTEVQLYNSGEAAWFLIQNGQITEFTLHLRSYDPTETYTMILGERQATAALNALNPQERFLQLCYEDMGGDTVTAGWVAR